LEAVKKFKIDRCPVCRAPGAVISWEEERDAMGRVYVTTELSDPRLERCTLNECHLRPRHC